MNDIQEQDTGAETHRVPRSRTRARRAPPKAAAKQAPKAPAAAAASEPLPSRGRSSNPSLARPVDLSGPNGEVLTRRSRKGSAGDEFAVPENLRKPGWDYQWWAETVLGQQQSQSEAYEGGWRPCTDERIMAHFCHPGWDKKFIERKGIVLYMRPMHLSEESRREDHEIATTQVSEKIKATLADTSGLPKSMPRRVQSVEVTAEVGTHKQEGSAKS